MSDAENARTAALSDAFMEAGAAHGRYEETELDGLYDQAWADWYADYLIQQGIENKLKRPIGKDELAARLQAADAAHRVRDPKRPWWQYYAEAFVADGL